MLLEEAAKLADAAVRDNLAKAASNELAASVADAMQAPKRLADSALKALPLPGFLRDGLSNSVRRARALCCHLS